MLRKLVFLLAFLVGCTNLQQKDAVPQKAERTTGKVHHFSNAYLAPIKQRQTEDIPVRFDGHPQRQASSEIFIPDEIKNLQEGQLFAELQDRYEAADKWGFESRYLLFMSKYAVSVRADEVLYMKAMFEFGERSYGSALTALNRLLKDYPHGRKAPAAMFAKGVIYKRLNLFAEAKEAMQNVGSHYPGSPESLRAKNELKILK
jgi:hypothetical protein